MGLDVQMMMRIPVELGASALAALNADLAWSMGRAFDLYTVPDVIAVLQPGGMAPIERTTDTDFGEYDKERGEDRRIEPSHRDPGFWYWIHVDHRVYAIGHEKGRILDHINVAEWLEFRIPGCELFYGSDHDDFLSPFPAAERLKLKHHFYKVGHGEYSSRHDAAK